MVLGAALSMIHSTAQHRIKITMAQPPPPPPPPPPPYHQPYAGLGVGVYYYDQNDLDPPAVHVSITRTFASDGDWISYLTVEVVNLLIVHIPLPVPPTAIRLN